MIWPCILRDMTIVCHCRQSLSGRQSRVPTVLQPIWYVSLFQLWFRVAPRTERGNERLHGAEILVLRCTEKVGRIYI